MEGMNPWGLRLLREESDVLFCMKDQVLKIEKKAIQDLGEVRDLSGLERFRIAYLGKKGLLTSLMKRLGELSPEERPEAGQVGEPS